MWSRKKNHLDPAAHIPFDVSAVSSLPREKGTAFKKKTGLTFSNHNHMTLNSKLKKPHKSQENTTFCSEKLREEASDNDNMKQVWKIMAVWEENTSKKFRLPLPKMEEAFCQRLQTGDLKQETVADSREKWNFSKTTLLVLCHCL